MEKKRMGLATRVLIGLALGVVVGIIVYGFPDGTLKDAFLINGLFQLVGQIFLRSIMMLVVPLVFISLVNGAASMGDIKKLGRVGVKTISFYLVTTAIAIVISLVIAFLINPGVGLDMGAIDAVDVSESETTPLVQILYEMVPTNPVASLSEGSMLQIIVFAILSGIALSIIGEKGTKVLELFEQLNELVMELVRMVMVLAPVGVFSLVARTFATVGVAALVPILKVVLGVYIGLVIHATLVYGGLLKAFTGLSIFKFYKKFYPAMAIAFSTASSNAALPVSMDLAENQIGVSKEIAAFALPLGATINMDG
ncbi:MAG TPA: dicarboxylate/amino acid:cation symporter, partial [Tissierellaceae bacterium]|nr:dicarboxylate/amino acid:cation symporter [Tissierellaceae bacterium]